MAAVAALLNSDAVAEFAAMFAGDMHAAMPDNGSVLHFRGDTHAGEQGERLWTHTAIIIITTTMAAAMPAYISELSITWARSADRPDLASYIHLCYNY